MPLAPLPTQRDLDEAVVFGIDAQAATLVSEASAQVQDLTQPLPGALTPVYEGERALTKDAANRPNSEAENGLQETTDSRELMADGHDRQPKDKVTHKIAELAQQPARQERGARRRVHSRRQMGPARRRGPPLPPGPLRPEQPAEAEEPVAAATACRRMGQLIAAAPRCAASAQINEPVAAARARRDSYDRGVGRGTAPATTPSKAEHSRYGWSVGGG